MTGLTISEVGCSDHYLVKFVLTSQKIKPATVTFSYRNLNKLDSKSFSNCLRKSTITTKPPTSTDEFVALLDNEVCRILDSLLPLKTKTKRCPINPHPDWINENVKQAKRDRRRLERRYKTSSSLMDYIAFRRASRLVSKCVANARKDYYHSKIEEASSTPREMWKVVNGLLHTSTNKSKPLDNDATQKFVNSCSSYFTQKLANIQDIIKSRLPSITLAQPPITSSLPQYTLTSLPRVTVLEVKALLKRHSLKPSPIDPFPSSLLAQCPDAFAPIIANLANISFSQGIFPSAFKSAQITPILKKPNLDPSDPANYRPISNLNTIGNIL